MKRLVAFLLMTLAFVSIPARVVFASNPRPDIIFILTDDQRFDAMRELPAVRHNFPVVYSNAYVSNPTCCPSRSTIQSGLYSHDNGVWTNSNPYGEWEAFKRWQDAGGISIAQTLQDAGYRTGLFGKYLNNWNDSWSPPGWNVFFAHDHNGSDGALSPYYDYAMGGWDENGPVYDVYGEQPSDYSTDVITQHTIDFISSTPTDQPLFAYYAPNAPHSDGYDVPPVPAPRDLNASVTVQRLGPAFDEKDVSDKPKWVRELTMLDPAFEQNWLTEAARSLIDVNRSIKEILHAQEQRDPGLSNTVMIFMSDNGFSNGDHRWNSKAIPYEEAIRIPMYAYYPGVPQTTIGALTTNLDVAPTFAAAAGVPFATNGDGYSLLDGAVPARTSFIIEGAVDSRMRVFCGVHTRHKVFVQYGTGETEFYNLKKDPHELVNTPDAKGVSALRDLAIQGCNPLPPTWPRSTLVP